jgi:hypothetical protein
MGGDEINRDSHFLGVINEVLDVSNACRRRSPYLQCCLTSSVRWQSTWLERRYLQMQAHLPAVLRHGLGLGFVNDACRYRSLYLQWCGMMSMYGVTVRERHTSAMLILVDHTHAARLSAFFCF